jgi:hypothetical protein
MAMIMMYEETPLLRSKAWKQKLFHSLLNEYSALTWAVISKQKQLISDMFKQELESKPYGISVVLSVW